MILFLVVFCMLVALGFSIAAALSDFKSMTIPNVYCLGIALAFVPAYAADALSGEGVEFFASWQSHLLAAAIVFGITFALFGLRMIGAGDSKLCTAIALWVATPGLAAFLFYMAITGAAVGIATKVLNTRRLVEHPKEGSWIARAQEGGAGVPYGIAICAGAVVSFFTLGYFSPAKLGLLAGITEAAP